MIQNQTINKILQTRDSTIITLNGLTEEYFSEYVNEFKFILNHLNKYDVIPDMATFLNTFPNFEVVTVNEPISYLLDELIKDRNKRFLAENFNKVRTLIMNDDVDSAMAILQKASQESTRIASLDAIELISDHSRYETYLDIANNHDKHFITTGFPELDAIIGGWNVEDDLVTIVARNGLGKSWMLFKCAVGAAMQGKTVGIYSGEMSEDSVGFRIDTLIGNLPNGSLIHGGASVKNNYKQFLESLNKIVPGKIYLITPKQINGSASVSILKAFIHKYKLEALYVDQHSLMKDDRKAREKVEKANNISEDLKILQSTERIAIIACAQQNREKLENGLFDTTQIANSDRIGQDSSYVFFIERDYDKELLKIHAVKVRNGQSNFTLTYRVDLNTGRFEYIPSENDEKLGIKNSGMSGYSDDEVF